MAPKTGSVSLVQFMPTDAELAAARTLLGAADNKVKKSKLNSMNVFLSGNIDGDGNAAVLQMTGSEKQAYIEKYLCYQSAKKSGRLTCSRTNVTDNMRHADVHSWNEYKCKLEVG